MPFPELEDATRLPPLASRYELIEPIARGGVAWVWRGHDLVLDRPVAVKVLRSDVDPSFAARFTIEAQTAAKVRHPGVVAVYDAGQHDGTPFLAMELIEGKTLRALLRENGPLSAEEVKRIGRMLAGALDAMRRAGLVHGDVKPENVIVRPDGSTTLTDLGLARAVWEAGAEDQDTIWGTPGYVAPERKRGEPGDHRSDVFSLGVLLFECATGVAAPEDGDIPWASLVRREIPEDLAATIARATLAEPDERYATAAAMALQLASDPDSDSGNHTRAIDVSERETVAMAPTVERRAAVARRNRQRRARIAGLGGLTIAVLAFFLLARGANNIEVPQLTGSTQEEAEETLTALGLDPGIAFAYDSEVPAGTVIEQDPGTGVKLGNGDTVTLTVSLGPRIVRVPEVTGMKPEVALEKLRHAGFVDIQERQIFSDIEAGRVAGTDPPEGELAEGDEPIFLDISKGIELIKIPGLAGTPRADAEARLEEAGLDPVIELTEHRAVAEGLVIGTRPPKGKKVRRGTQVTLVVSTGLPKVEVPNLRCMKEKDAEKLLEQRGLKASSEGGGKRIVDQDPAPGRKIEEGSTVSLLLGPGAFC